VAATKECPRHCPSAFVVASLNQLIAAARLPGSGISETAVNASLAFIEGAKPRDEIECALVIRMACTHSAAMAVLNRLGGAAGERTVAAMASAAARLLRAYAATALTCAGSRSRFARRHSPASCAKAGMVYGWR
jgi:hypothetical protein